MSTTRVSPQELARRRQAAARQNLARAVDDREALRVRLGAHEATAGAGIAVPQVPAVSEDAESIERAAAELREAVREAESALDSRLADRRRSAYDAAYRVACEQVRSIGIEHYRAETPGVQEKPTTDAAAGPGVVASMSADASAALARILGRLPRRIEPSTEAEVAKLVEMLGLATSSTRQERVLDRLRRVVQAAADAQRRFEANRPHVDRLLARLDGAPGDEAARLRGFLRAHDPAVELPPDIDRQVDRAVAELSAQERQDLLSAVQSWLEVEGYDVDVEAMEDVGAEGVIVDHRASGRHGVLVRQRGDEVLFNVVRFDDELERDLRADLEAEQQFCTDLSSFIEEAARHGVGVAIEQSDADGKLQIMERRPMSSRQQRTLARRSTRARERRR